eukprot:CAMPEP_0171390832 /NCGR_PEP_ID=MMETSP0880-20121228/834_1 /TAXON_ID=67004 /ORGANISM="Thalassiosira weissflogii, Strain CCMP1336" /LENGTH=86 /DNA_ID=CAMNT_0011903325 /DNA_START=311 /DNA_END=568 /DNA_ORIENTATION=+
MGGAVDADAWERIAIDAGSVGMGALLMPAPEEGGAVDAGATGRGALSMPAAWVEERCRCQRMGGIAVDVSSMGGGSPSMPAAWGGG